MTARWWAPARTRAALAVASACVLTAGVSGCAEDDPLDPERLAQIAVSSGDAEGDALSGGWFWSFELESCPCSNITLFGDQEIDPCLFSPLDVYSDSQSAQATGVQADGFFLLRGTRAHLSGPLDDDGSLTLAAVLNLDIVDVLALAEGAVAAQGNDQVLTAHYRQRMTLRYGGSGTCETTWAMKATLPP